MPLVEPHEAERIKIHIITVGFSNATQLAHSLGRFYAMPPFRVDFNHWIVSGHYPLDHDRNEKRIVELASDYGAFYIDPGKDLGSAQSQNWMIEKLDKRDGDYIVNLDPDSACDVPGWLDAMYEEMESDPKLAMVHLTNPYVWERIRFGYHPFKMQMTPNGRELQIPMAPEQFNITMYRYSWLKEIGGILQGSPYYGNVEGLMWQRARETGMYSGYLYDLIEDYSLKRFEDKEHRQYKMSHCHPDRFFIPYFGGTFGEFCKLHGYK